MAGAAIGALHVNLGLNSAQFKKGLKNSQRNLASFSKAAKVGLAGVAVVFAGITAAFVKGSIVQEKSLAQLNAVLKSTSGIVGISSKQLQGMAANLQNVTTYGDETIISAQSLLLTFTKIGKEAFPQALEATLNVATAMGTDLKSAAIQVGKALNDPVLGMSALSRSGITFSEDQKEVIKALVETGDVAGAQTIMLKELETQFGGSARAARDTLGGALKALQNAFGDLFELSGEGIDDLKGGIEQLIGLISDPKTKEAFVKFGSWAVSALGAIVNVANDVIGAVDKIIKKLKWAATHDIFGNELEPNKIQQLKGILKAKERLKNSLYSGNQKSLDEYSSFFPKKLTPVQFYSFSGLGNKNKDDDDNPPSSINNIITATNIANDNALNLVSGLEGVKNAGQEMAETIAGAFHGIVARKIKWHFAQLHLASLLSNVFLNYTSIIY